MNKQSGNLMFTTILIIIILSASMLTLVKVLNNSISSRLEQDLGTRSFININLEVAKILKELSETCSTDPDNIYLDTLNLTRSDISIIIENNNLTAYDKRRRIEISNLHCSNKTSEDSNKIKICHNKSQNIIINKEALKAHKDHGDSLGDCSGNSIIGNWKEILN